MFIEFALVVPLLTLFSLGIVNYGLQWRAANDVNAAARDAARVGTSATTYGFADRAIVKQVATTLRSSDGTIQKIVVFNASGTTSTVPANCLTAAALSARGINGVCNVYSTTDVAWVKANMTSTANFQNGNPAPPKTPCGNTWDKMWCPTQRNNSLANGNLDYLGVYIQVKNPDVTHAGFGDQMIARTAVFRLEPNYGGT